MDYDLETEEELQEVESIEDSIDEEEEEEDFDGEDIGDFIASEDNDSANGDQLLHQSETLVIDFKTKNSNRNLRRSLKAINISGDDYPIQVSLGNPLEDINIITKEIALAVLATEDRAEMYGYLEPFRKQ